MKMTINFCDFRDAFTRHGRENQFSYEGLKALYEHFEELDPDYELDVIALCCEFFEMKNLRDTADECGLFCPMDEEPSDSLLDGIEGNDNFITWIDEDKGSALFCQ